MTTRPAGSTDQPPQKTSGSTNSQQAPSGSSARLANSNSARANTDSTDSEYELVPGVGEVAELHTLITTPAMTQMLLEELKTEIDLVGGSSQAVVDRIAAEVERVCHKSDRIQTSGRVGSWQISLARHRLQKCIAYYRLGSRQGRVDLHSSLSALVYRYIAPNRSQLSFQARYTLIEDFLQNFYVEVLKTFRRENQLADTYTPRTRLELAEYMAFTEHYAKRRINLPGCGSQRLIVLRAQGFARRQPQDATMDIEMAVESGKGEEAEMYARSPIAHQIREQMVASAIDSSDATLRENIISELLQYLESQGQKDCIDYLVLRLQDLSAQEIDEILELSPRQRDYLQQRFKYHVDKFARSHQWKLVHQWLGADLDQNLGMVPQTWQSFLQTITPEQQQLIQLKRAQRTDQEIAQQLNCTPKQAQKRWSQLLELAWEFRNQRPEAG
jgi:DNA-binding CsgD family transcriptional regulator